MLSSEEFVVVVERTPLVSIDLVVVDDDGRILVGKRTNEPALGTWFVPGGRINKNETLDAAFERIANDELGPGNWIRADAALLGVFEHFYDTNFTGAAGAGTHYVVIAYAIEADGIRLDQIPLDQHAAVEWVASGGLTGDGRTVALHVYTEAYFGFVSEDRDSGSVASI